MPYFKVRLSGAGISYPVEGPDPVIGFFTTRLVQAPNLMQAQHVATELVLSEWRPGGQYAGDNAGSLPQLVVEELWPVSLLSGIFGRKPRGYTFYTRD